MVRSDQKMKAVIGKFFDILGSILENRSDGCCQPNARITPNGSHRTITKSLLAELPEVLTLNLNWPDSFPKAGSVLKTLLSLPEEFNCWDMYKHSS